MLMNESIENTYNQDVLLHKNEVESILINVVIEVRTSHLMANYQMNFFASHICYANIVL